MALYFDETTDSAGAFRGDVQQAVAKATHIFAIWELSRYAIRRDIAWNELDHETRDLASEYDIDADSSRDLVDQTVNDLINGLPAGGITKTVTMAWGDNFADAEPDSAEIMLCGGGPTVRLVFDFAAHGAIDADSLELRHSWGADSGVLRFSDEHQEAAAFVAEYLTS